MAQIASAFSNAGAFTIGARYSVAKDGAGRPPGSTWAVLFFHGRVTLATYQLFITFIGPMFGIDPARWGIAQQAIACYSYGLPRVYSPFRYSDNYHPDGFQRLSDFAVAAVLTIAKFVAAGADA